MALVASIERVETGNRAARVRGRHAAKGCWLGIKPTTAAAGLWPHCMDQCASQRPCYFIFL